MSTPAEILATVRSMLDDALMEGSSMDIESVQSFDEPALPSNDPTLILVAKDGQRYELTICRSWSLGNG
jgi:hypothetical protein